MRNTRAILAAAVFAATLLVAGRAMADTFGTGGNQFTIDFVPILGDASSVNGTNISQYSPGDSTYKAFTDPGNDYRMGTYEITNDQWNKFQASLGVPVTGNPSDAYDQNPYWTGTNVPTNRASWYEAAQFVNWLNTSTGHQPAYKFTGTQGTSDYTFATWSPADAADKGTNLYRNKDAVYYLPTEDEWVKAAYWNGTSIQTYSNLSSSDLVSGWPDATKWNYGPSVGEEPWDVGSGTRELNGTYDMMGNVKEWTESPYVDTLYGTDSLRGVRGGCYYGHGYDFFIASSTRDDSLPSTVDRDIGFRVASVPEPATLSLLALGAVTILRRRDLPK